MIVLVIGAGRCGSSTVARLLHEKCNVNMGDPWVRPPDNFNPQGYYEDLAFGNILQNLMTERVKDEDTLQQVSDMLVEEIKDRYAKHTQWGFKANTLYTCLPTVTALLPEVPYIIRCRRPIHQMIFSWVKTFKKPFRQCMVEVLLREHMMDLLEEHQEMTTIHFNTVRKKTDAEILAELCQAIPGLRYSS